MFFVALSSGAGSDEFEAVLSTMNSDDVTTLIKTDDVILTLGRQLYESYELSKESEVSSKMRILGRFLLTLRNQTDEMLFMKDVINPMMFDKVIAAVKEVANLKPKAKENSTPSLALKLGHELKKAALLVKANGIRMKNAKMVDEADNYIYLHTTEWPRLISKYSLKALIQKKATQTLPFSSDLHVRNTIKFFSKILL